MFLVPPSSQIRRLVVLGCVLVKRKKTWKFSIVPLSLMAFVDVLLTCNV